MAVGLGLTLVTGSRPAGAQSTRTFVSGVGDDSFACSRPAPCKTFGAVISKTAAAGEIDVLDAGGFGAVTITKAITIRSDQKEAGILVSGTNGIVVAAGPNDNVILRGLDIEGIGTGINGIRYLSGKSLTVENTTINNFTQAGIDVELGAAGELYVHHTEIRNNGGAGVFVKSTAGEAQATISDTRLLSNGLGVNARDNARVMLTRSTVSGNAAAGLQAQADTTDAELAVDYSLISFNATGVVVGGGSGNRPALFGMSRATILDNPVTIDKAAAGTVTSAGNNRVLTPPPPPPTCTPRPRVDVHTAQNGAGQLLITLTANTTPPGGPNTIDRLTFPNASNARIDVPNGPQNSPGGVVQDQPANTTTLTFNIRRAAAGAFTVPIIVHDGCGDWKTFVGGGPGVP